jgi:Flp pilus assembly protein TadG
MRLTPPTSRRRRAGPATRAGVAAVEMGFTFMVFVFPLMIGIWEIGRMVQVQQIVSNAAREGARLAGQGTTIRSDGTITQINVSTGTPNIRDVVYQYLLATGLTGLTLSDIDVQFAFTSGSGTQPYEGIKNQPFTVTVKVKWDKVRWVDLGIIRPQWVTFTVNWRMLVDEPFSVNQTLPTF